MPGPGELWPRLLQNVTVQVIALRSLDTEAYWRIFVYPRLTTC